jgi:Spy/CpxP family protein refolding chaperone
MSTNVKPWVFLAMIFVAGIMTGVALTIGIGPHFKSSPGEQQMKNGWTMFLTKQLNLTSDQQAKIGPIIGDAVNQMQVARKDNLDRVSQIIQKANDQISAILTPDQKTELQKLSADMEKRRDHMFPGGHHPWGGPHGPGGGPGPGGPGGPPPNH